MKTKIKPLPATAPINVAIPNTTELKMQSILAVARAIENLSNALISTNVEVRIENNLVQGCEWGIRVQPEL